MEDKVKTNQDAVRISNYPSRYILKKQRKVCILKFYDYSKQAAFLNFQSCSYKKGKPLPCRNQSEYPSKEAKQAYLNRTVKGCFRHSRHILKKKTPVFALHALHRTDAATYNSYQNKHGFHHTEQNYPINKDFS